MAYVSTIVSGAACLGVLIGLISGIFFLVLTAMKWVSRVRSTLQEEELTRQKRFLVSSLIGEDFREKRKTENGVGSASQVQTGESFQRGAEKPESWNEHPEGQKEGPSRDTVEVREVMEKMVETMIGGPLDGTTVGPLSTHSAYKNENSSDLTGSNLKRLIKEIVDEAMALPDLKEAPSPPKAPKDAPEDFQNKSYEDILATAILNKVIESFQNRSRKEGEPDVENPKPRLRHRRFKKNNGNDDLRSDGDWSDTSRSDQLSLTIEEYIEEVTTAVDVSEDENSELSDLETNAGRRIPFPESGRTVVDAGTDDENSDVEEQSTATELVTSTSSWEENWLFQKKRLRSTPNAHHPVPVPMLVPNPSEDFRALVGGVDADDLSDMSECSDSLLEDFITTEEKPPEVVPPQDDSGENPKETVKVILTHITEESFYDKLGVSRPGDGEKTDSAVSDPTVETVEQKPPDPVGDVQSPREDSFLENESGTESHFPSAGSVLLPSSTDSEDSLIRCRVAEREKEKWMNPVPLPDNPYSPENIEKREQQQRKRNEYFRIGTYSGESIDFPDEPTSSDEPFKKDTERPPFARDYYVNASKHPSGRSSPSFDQVSTHSHEPFSSWGRTCRSRLSRLHPDIADGSAQYFAPHIRPFQTFSSQHFSQVFKTSHHPPKPRKYRYGSHTLKLRPRETLLRNKPFHQQLSDFEQKSLREDLTHSLLRARDATPNFILNPVFNPDLSEVPFPSLPYDINRHPQIHSESSAPPTASCCPLPPNSPTTHSSGYGSDSLDHSSDSLEFWRLTPPKTPEVLQTSFVSIANSRKSKQKPRNGVRKSLSSFY